MVFWLMASRVEGGGDVLWDVGLCVHVGCPSERRYEIWGAESCDWGGAGEQTGWEGLALGFGTMRTRKDWKKVKVERLDNAVLEGFKSAK